MSTASKQVHAPPTPKEDKAIQAYRRKHGPQETYTWSTVDGWCSACKTTGVRVAHMGHDGFNFALCGECLGRLQTEFAPPAPGEGKS